SDCRTVRRWLRPRRVRPGNRAFVLAADDVGPAHAPAHAPYLLAEGVDLHVAHVTLGIDVAHATAEVWPVITDDMCELSRFSRAVALSQDCSRDEIAHVVE